MYYLMQQMVSRAAQRWPDRPAFRCGDDELSYSELDALSDRLANCLNEGGVERGARVAIYLNKSLECAVAIYGVLKAGAAYVPLDPGAPVERLRLIIKECGAAWLVTQDAKAKGVEKLLGNSDLVLGGIIGLSGLVAGYPAPVSWEAVRARRAAPPDNRGRTADDLAYIMFTSGSTGAPKGIMHSHASGLSYALMAAALYELTPEDRLSNLPPLHFDQSIFDYFSGVAAGSCTVIIPEAYSKLPASLSELIERERLTVWYSVPFALIQLLLHGALEERDMSELRSVLFGGETFPSKHLAALMQAWPGARFFNVYGPAEVNQCTHYPLPDAWDGEQAGVPIGRECPNVELLVLDAEDNPVSVGEAGELLVRTPTMMLGYFGQPELNQCAFYTLQNADGTDHRFYRTGDLVAWDQRGELIFLGRSDRQVKLRGYRVELEEIEAVFDTHPDVEQSAVFVVEGDGGHSTLEVAVCLHATANCPERELRQYASRKLPSYAIPALVHLVEEFPRTSTGKISHTALKANIMKGAPVEVPE